MHNLCRCTAYLPLVRTRSDTPDTVSRENLDLGVRHANQVALSIRVHRIFTQARRSLHNNSQENNHDSSDFETISTARKQVGKDWKKKSVMLCALRKNHVLVIA